MTQDTEEDYCLVEEEAQCYYCENKATHRLSYNGVGKHFLICPVHAARNAPYFNLHAGPLVYNTTSAWSLFTTTTLEELRFPLQYKRRYKADLDTFGATFVKRLKKEVKE